jgi:hypothetical protein
MVYKKGGVPIGKHPALHTLHIASEGRCRDTSLTDRVSFYVAVFVARQSTDTHQAIRAKRLVPGAGPVEGSVVAST